MRCCEADLHSGTRTEKKCSDKLLRRSQLWNKEFGDEAKDLLKKLLEPNPSKRLGNGPEGANEIKNHIFFKEIDWNKLYKRELEPPFVPEVENEEDTNQIDPLFTRELPQETPVISNLQDDEKQRNHFGGFTFDGKDILKTQSNDNGKKNKSKKK